LEIEIAVKVGSRFMGGIGKIYPAHFVWQLGEASKVSRLVGRSKAASTPNKRSKTVANSIDRAVNSNWLPSCLRFLSVSLPFVPFRWSPAWPASRRASWKDI